METRRSNAITVAIMLLVLLSLATIATVGAPTGKDGIPLAVIWASVVLGIAGLAAAVGLWQRRRWGIVVSVTVLALTALAAAPGVVAAPSTELQIGAILTLVAVAATITLLVLPNSRKVFA